MFAYNLKLALLSLRRSPAITTLMVFTIALGIGGSTTAMSVYYLMSRNPIPEKSDQLYYVRMDNWVNGPYGYREPEDPPEQITYRDSVSLLEDARGTYQSASYNAGVLVYPGDEAEAPQMERGRVVSADFFPMFDVPFLFGGPWDQQVEAEKEQVVVLSQETNERLFGGVDSVGEEVRLEDRIFRVVGVVDDWSPMPKFYDVQGGQVFRELESLFVPFGLISDMEIDKGSGNTSCPVEMGEGWQGFLDSECIWIQYWVQLDTPQEAADYLAYLDAYVTEQKELGRFPRPLNNSVTPVMEWLEYMEVVDEDARVLLGVSFMFLVVCLLNAVGLLLDKFLGRPGEIALRRALGASKPAMFYQHLIEVGVIGIGGGIFGIGVAYLGLVGLDQIYRGFDRFVRLDVTMLSAGLLIALVASVAAGLYPSWRSCQVPPAEHLKTQ